MKRIAILGSLILGFCFLVGEVAWAQVTPPPTRQQAQQTPQQRLWGPRFVDANGDGICDLYGQGGRGMGRGQAAGGMGRGRAAGGGWGPAFVDANGDGICDNLAQGGRGMGRGQAAGGGRGRGRVATLPANPVAPPVKNPKR
jgi:hypothetical protein